MTTTRPTLRDAAVDLALARGILYGVTARALRYPDRQSLDSLGATVSGDTLRAAAARVDAERGEALRVGPGVERLVESSRVDLVETVRDYARLFGHTARGVVCPYETEYGASAPFQQPQALADIAGYYRAFGLKPRSSTEQRVDHVACEAEFMEFLALKEAYGVEALGQNASSDGPGVETLEETRRASRSFLRDHFGRFGLAFATMLEREDSGGFYGAVGGLLARWVRAECERLELPVGPSTLELRPDETGTVEGGCGTANELIQIQRSR